MLKSDGKGTVVTDEGRYTDPELVLQPRRMALVVKELEKIHAKHGKLQPENILEEATPRDHPLHRFFEWDDEKAGYRYRINQARAMIIAARVLFERKVKAHEEAGVIKLRRFINRGPGEGFNDRAAVLEEGEVKMNLIRSRLRAIRSSVHELYDVSQLDSFRKTVDKEIEKVAHSLNIEL